MNKAITDGLVLEPPAFQDGLAVWSSEDGTPGSATYASAPNAAVVPGDADFGTCLELVKTASVTRLRYMGETPILPGCYLKITVRLKAVSGSLPSVRIAGFAGGPGDALVGSVPATGASTALTGYGDIVEVTAIVGSGARTGVDMIWGDGVLYGHFGLDLTGPTGGVVRIDDIRIEDVTAIFHRKMMDWVDVTDFGALGDGVTDDSAAFLAADAAAAGRGVLVPEGLYRLEQNTFLNSRFRFVGTLTMPEDKRVILRNRFDYPSYIDAFGDETTALKKAFQALLYFSDHDGLDLGGRRIEIEAPIDMAAAVATLDSFEIRRVIRNGQINAVGGANWTPDVTTRTAAYDPSDAYRLTGVADAGGVPVGSKVDGTGVGREVYVTSVNPGAGTVELSQPLYAAPGSQTYTFTRFKYLLDFSGFTKLSQFVIADVEFRCNGLASGLLLAPAGETMHLTDCAFIKPLHRAITSHGRGCQDLQVDRCQFRSDEQSVPATDRISLALNINANDAKIRDNRFQRFGTTMVLHGNGHLIVGNHWFQGDSVTDGPRVPGLVFTYPNVKSVITGNYIDNCFVEWTNEHDAAPDFSSEFSFGGLTITGNIFTVNDAAPWFSWLVVKPFGAGHFVQGLSVTGNTFKSLNGTTDRIERVDDSFADLDAGLARNILFQGNTFNGIGQNTINPVVVQHDQATPAASWLIDPSGFLPFGGRAREVTGLVAEGAIEAAGGASVFAMPFVTTEEGADKAHIRLTWPDPVTGRVHATVRTDRPI